MPDRQPLERYVPRCPCGRGATYFVHHSNFVDGKHVSTEPKCLIVKLHCKECCNA